ncbi:cellobiose phosphorylase [Idiomarina sp. A28L]|uniref:GH36-type glycosyl hydrolase domain-containing protein n=1 Tax=Idiomarina sp. A28L TaxID=1036674 RepID=UPI0002138BB3|nr:glucoamylase family protein [Idiomarina sp. A28L]EGN75111.1 cellobiose phosphorylase [Idiomarina sp. A28L]
MNLRQYCVSFKYRNQALWKNREPIREEMFGIERLEHHAESLAQAQGVSENPLAVLSLRDRLEQNASALISIYGDCVKDMEAGKEMVPAAEWLLDNYHLVEAQVREIRQDLPAGFYKQLPKLASGPFAGYPRVFGLAWAFIAHTDSHLDPDVLALFISAYQRVQPLSIGELWAVPITLRIVLVENLCRLGEQITREQARRDKANNLADCLLRSDGADAALEAFLRGHDHQRLSETFAAQLVTRLRAQDPVTTPALRWLDKELQQLNLSVDVIVEHIERRQSGANVSIRNVISSMRLISDIDWADLFESVSLVDARLRASSNFATMNFATRNLYRNAIEELAHHSGYSELAVVDKLNEIIPTNTDPGFYLIGQYRPQFEKAIGFKIPFRIKLGRAIGDFGIGGFVGTIIGISIALLIFALYLLQQYGSMPFIGLVLFSLFAFLPATNIAMVLISRVIIWGFNPTILPSMEFKNGIPDNYRTLIAVPTLLSCSNDIIKLAERLEVHYLTCASNNSNNLYFALITDWVDSDNELNERDTELLDLATHAIENLNKRYANNKFLLLHRRRVFNESENVWMGWERKRGKLHELNRLLRGATDTTFIENQASIAQLPDNFRYVITLDSDTRIISDTVTSLIGKMAHPLNQPYLDKSKGRITLGYGILQPRVTPSFPNEHRGSIFQMIYSGPGGIDPYAAATSDLYQDLFQEGSYTGKGIYDIDAFEAALENRIPENTLLSHDLFEGIYARAGLASDVEVIEDFPESYDVAVKRQHRWTRGDWQLITWILNLGSSSPRTGSQAVPLLGRFKMIDNLRRSLIPPFTFTAILCCFLFPWPLNAIAIGFVLISIVLPAFMPILYNLWPRRHTSSRSYLNAMLADTKLAIGQTILTIAFLPDQAWRMADAIGRTLVRIFITHHHLLEWTTSAQIAAKPCQTVFEFYREMAASTFFSVVVIAAAIMITPYSWPLILCFAVLWFSAPWLAFATSRTAPIEHKLASPQQATELRLIARRTWRYFEVFVGKEDNMLPPDNFQETPNEVVAHRTSPTNIGVYLLSAIAARDFGWAGMVQTIERLEATFATMQNLKLFRGHFFNWYSTNTLKPLTPNYISSVDSGNLAGHLLVVANACEEWISNNELTCPLDASPTHMLGGHIDNCQLAQQAFKNVWNAPVEIRFLLEEIEQVASEPPAAIPSTALINELISLVSNLPDDSDEHSRVFELRYWVQAIEKNIHEYERDTLQRKYSEPLCQRLETLASTAREFALNMDFGFLIDPQRQLLAIGYSLDTNSRDESCYDLLASEARLASLFAIAKGDVNSKHWFRLGRSATPIMNGSALISWSGSMFEYLMPSLVMQTPAGSILSGTMEFAVKLQQSYASSLNIPWGMSESAFNARDHEFTYQYSNFGVPELGFKRGLRSDRVIAPYATGLATMIEPTRALANYNTLTKLGALGRFGFYEALDFTPSRLPENKEYVIIRSFMAHHQGMTIAAISNALKNNIMCKRFHREPIIQACELLLQERMPRDIATPHQLAAAVELPINYNIAGSSTRRQIKVSRTTPLITHMLGNGQYSVMLTATGSGYSRWRDIAITRWQPDGCLESYGTFIFLRDIKTNQCWSIGDPHYADSDVNGDSTVEFNEEHAEFVHHDAELKSSMEVVVSMEDDGEVRRLSLSNFDNRAKEIEITSYAEVVLNTLAADQAHPAFSKMFVETEYLDKFDALIATRRTQSSEDKHIWAAHLVVVEAELTATPEFESDRARFLGRGRTLANAVAMQPEASLSNTAGTVLDPIFSLRRRIIIEARSEARITFWTLVAESKEALIALLDKHHDRNAFARAKTLAWTQAQLQLRHLNIGNYEAVDFQRLATPLLYQDARFRSSARLIRQGAAPQSALWETGISGDLPIILIHIDNIKHINQVLQLIRAHEYWQLKQLCVDLVIFNEQPSSYIQELQDAIEAAIRTNYLRANISAPTRGTIYALRSDQISLTARALLASACWVKLYAAAGSLRNQLNRIPPMETPAIFLQEPITPRQRKQNETNAEIIDSATSLLKIPELEFFNGIGGFAENGREYVISLSEGEATPAPWINVIANHHFGFQVSAEGSSYTWAKNSRDNQLTPWSNDPVSDPSGEALYVRDEDNMAVFGATINIKNFPANSEYGHSDAPYIATHGFGYSRFQHQAHGIELDLLQFVPLQHAIKISRLRLHNHSKTTRRLSVTAFVSWVLGASRSGSAPFIYTEHDSKGAILARNPWSLNFSSRVAFADMAGKQSSFTADRSEFLGRAHARTNGISSLPPLALASKRPLSGTTGVALDPCAAMQQLIWLEPGESTDVVFLLGQGESASEAKELLAAYRQCEIDELLAEVKQHWQSILGVVQVKTPDRAMDIMLNGWLTYQTLACRIWARSGFYQASGAYGFRDQLQDGMALTFAKPDETREHILRAAAHQFVEGDVQHWWMPSTNNGVRTRISDDRVWLVYATARYIENSGDIAILNEQVPYIEGPQLNDDEHDSVFPAKTTKYTESLFEHCARALEQSIELRGVLGLPLIGTGDWNDGMNRVGPGGKGESVWLGWLLLKALKMFAPLAKLHNRERAQVWANYAKTLQKVIEQVSWDGEWYRRATYDDGSWLGSWGNQECRIDSIAQSWAVLSGGADNARAAHAMSSLNKQLISEKNQLVILFTPPFNYGGQHPGYIQGYPPGLRENGGNYSHAAMWVAEAYAELGDGNQAVKVFNILNPINHALTAEEATKYKVEPYVVAADIYSVAPHIGRGGWTWYTGAAGCMYRAGLEGILGLKKRGDKLVIKPCIARCWPKYEIALNLDSGQYQITVENPQKRSQGITHAELDGEPLQHNDDSVEVPLDGKAHLLLIRM